MESQEIVNRVAQSGIITLDMDLLFDKTPQSYFDLEPLLFQGMILREKDFRDFLKDNDWNKYEGHHVLIHCSGEAIIPSWAYMLLVTKLQPFAKSITYGDNVDELDTTILLDVISELDVKPFVNARVVLKGCSSRKISPKVYVALTNRLLPHVQSLMYGEPCSTVPVFKRK
ncbi:MAG: DUF2480 family protein [Cyclobacteriaceae bacterium]